MAIYFQVVSATITLPDGTEIPIKVDSVEFGEPTAPAAPAPPVARFSFPHILFLWSAPYRMTLVAKDPHLN